MWVESAGHHNSKYVREGLLILATTKLGVRVCDSHCDILVTCSQSPLSLKYKAVWYVGYRIYLFLYLP